MKNVMLQGELEGTIFLDTIQPKNNLYGIGPVAYLKGELLIIDGESYVSKVETDSTMIVEKTFDVKAPFFVYATVAEWNEEILPDMITNLETLETYLDEKFKNHNNPFVFKLSGKINAAKIHIVNLPEGSKVSSPEEAHKGLTYFPLKNEEVEIIGFFSRKHQTVFTHHDTYMHLHLITNDKQKMGHLDAVEFETKQTTLHWQITK
ncbi:MAG: acetolactate decarboxylase [Flavobacteriaceae bacterium]